jgi:hypothetical protein
MTSPTRCVLTCRTCGQPNDGSFGNMEFHLACLRRSGQTAITDPALRAAVDAKYPPQPDLRASLAAASGTHDRVRELAPVSGGGHENPAVVDQDGNLTAYGECLADYGAAVAAGEITTDEARAICANHPSSHSDQDIDAAPESQPAEYAAPYIDGNTRSVTYGGQEIGRARAIWEEGCHTALYVNDERCPDTWTMGDAVRCIVARHKGHAYR